MLSENADFQLDIFCLFCNLPLMPWFCSLNSDVSAGEQLLKWYLIPASTANLYELKFPATVCTAVPDQCLPLLLRIRKGLLLKIVCVCGVCVCSMFNVPGARFCLLQFLQYLHCWDAFECKVQRRCKMAFSCSLHDYNVQIATNIAQSNCAWRKREKKRVFVRQIAVTMALMPNCFVLSL